MENEIIIKLSSLGCGFTRAKEQLNSDPEKTIIEALQFFWTDKKIFTMLVGLLKYRIHHLVNVKRLATLSEDIDNGRKAILGVLAMKTAKSSGDSRFKQLARRMKAECKTLKNCPPQYRDSFYIKRHGVDEDFKKFNIAVADFFDNQPERKFKPLKKIYAENLWLRIRALMGAEYRADAIFLRLTNRANNQAAAARILGCHRSSISRVWSSLQNFNEVADYLIPKK